MAGYPVINASGVDVPNIDGSTTHYDLGDVVPLSKLISRRYSWMVERGYLSEAETDDWGTAAWGEITGTLSNQTDLQSALDAKLNLTGGTLTGNLTISKASPLLKVYGVGTGATISIDADSNSVENSLVFRNGGTTRVSLGLATSSSDFIFNSTSTGGRNAGFQFINGATTLLTLANTGAVTLNGTLTNQSTTDSTSSTTGSINTAGGLGVAKALYVGTDANVAGTIEASDVRAISQVMGAF